MPLPDPHFTGDIMAAIARAVVDAPNGIAIDQRQANGSYGIHQARVRIANDPRPYRLILAPADAPLGIINPGKIGDLSRGYVLDDHFAEPLA